MRYQIEHIRTKAVICSGNKVSMGKIQKNLGDSYRSVVAADQSPPKCCG